MNLFLDSSVIIEYLRQNEDVKRKMDSFDGEQCSSYICMAELYEGVASDTYEEQRKRLKYFFTHLDTIYGINREIAQEFGKIRYALRKEGTMIDDIDIFIAATCIVKDCILYTQNRTHFARIPNLKLLD